MDSRFPKELTNAERERLKCSAWGNTSMQPTQMPKSIRDRMTENGDVPPKLPRKSKE